MHATDLRMSHMQPPRASSCSWLVVVRQLTIPSCMHWRACRGRKGGLTASRRVSSMRCTKSPRLTRSRRPSLTRRDPCSAQDAQPCQLLLAPTESTDAARYGSVFAKEKGQAHCDSDGAIEHMPLAGQLAQVLCRLRQRVAGLQLRNQLQQALPLCRLLR